MNFNELLNRPLPSAARYEQFTESENPIDETFNEEPEIANIPEVEPEVDPVIGRGIESEPINQPVVPTNDVENDAPVPVDTLTPDESQRVDDTLNAVATPLLIQGEGCKEVAEFVESVDSDIAVAEGFLTEKTIVKFDKNAKRAQLFEVAVAAVAREKKDPLYKKLQTVYKMERQIKAKLRKKYNAPAKQKVKEYLARAKKSKSGLIARIAKKITGKK